jgi:hypothetical protein
MAKVIRDHTGAEWDVEGDVATARKKGVLSNAPPRCRLVQAQRETESPPMKTSGGQQYEASWPNSRSGGEPLPREVSSGGIRTVSSGGAPKHKVPRRSR